MKLKTKLVKLDKAFFAVIFRCLLSAIAVIPTITFSGEIEVSVNFSQHQLNSKILDEERTYQVSLPLNYNNPLYAKANYPVIYMLDGQAYHLLGTGLIERMAMDGNIPQAIIVSIWTNQHRMRDLTPSHSLLDWQNQPWDFLETSGGGAKFLAFLQSELIPYIENVFRTVPHRTLVGHSLGGLMVAQSFLAQQGLFQAYISIDGSLWWNNQELIQNVDRIEQKQKARLYFSVADHEMHGVGDLSSLVLGNRRFVEKLQKLHLPKLKVELQKFDDETHGSVAIISLYKGLRYVFEGHRFKYGWAKNVDEFNAHYSDLSARYGFDYRPQEMATDRQAYWGGKARVDTEIIRSFLALNVKNYPASSHAHSRLADLYRREGNEKLAKSYYQKALAISPDNVEAQQGLEVIK